jgi:hypothetical protein
LTTAAPLEVDCELIVSLPIDTPEQVYSDFGLRDADLIDIMEAMGGGHEALHLAVRAGARPAVSFEYVATAGVFPDWIFRDRGARHETPSTELRGLVESLAPQCHSAAERVERIMRHVQSRFAYGRREVGLGDDRDEMPALVCDIELGTCVDTHSYAVAALRAAGLEAAYVTGVFFPAGSVAASPGHCWVVVRAPGAPCHWDVSHHLKYDLGPVRPGLNPRPGRRFALGAGRDLVFDTPHGERRFARMSGFEVLGGDLVKPHTLAVVIEPEDGKGAV